MPSSVEKRGVGSSHATADCLDVGIWMDENETEPYLAECINDFVRGRGGGDDVGNLHRPGSAQDYFGWRMFLEGMVVEEVANIQGSRLKTVGSLITIAIDRQNFHAQLVFGHDHQNYVLK